MTEHVTIERHDPSGLVKWRWRFWYDRHTLWLDTYAELQRPSKRHKFKVTANYLRVDPRESTLTETDVVLPADVKAEAVAKLIEGIGVKRWGER